MISNEATIKRMLQHCPVCGKTNWIQVVRSVVAEQRSEKSNLIVCRCGYVIDLCRKE